MADLPHRGPNISRMPLEGTGGFIVASLPGLCLLLATPLGFAVWLAAVAGLVPLVFWATHRAQDRMDTGDGVVGFSFLLVLATLLSANTQARMAISACAAAGLATAVVINWRGQNPGHPSIRDYSA